VYRELPVISAEAAIQRYNDICIQLKIDATAATTDSTYFNELEESW
jgi:hypothetical protein